ncbi:MAG TPA: hypothetical protein DCQ93_09905 [Bacteroidetes bacterium]|nr:hypothetical protein [Bacteroidota bacterium]
MLLFSILIFAIEIISSCKSNESSNGDNDSDAISGLPLNSAASVISNEILTQGDSTAEPDTSDYSNFYIVIVDTSSDYFLLRKEMFQLHEFTSQKIDTMNRYFNKKKNEIVLNENDEDEMYRGTYFPRRFSGEELSLEYLNQYTGAKNLASKTIALVAGIFENKSDAELKSAEVKKHFPKTFALYKRMYVGCMH